MGNKGFTFHIFFSSLIACIALNSCKCKKQTPAPVASAPQVQQQSPVENPNYIQAAGKISLQHKANCGAEIIVVTKMDTLTLIPLPALTGFDTEGMEVAFSYRKLKVHNPRGCAGMPVQIAEIKKK
ncbi:MAG: hypothetical protein HY063_02420 [Bacteroidetes bacterium]|nr:hypothetical protein [Bacteroidota bacterium]